MSKLKPATLYLNTDHMARLSKLAVSRGLKASQLTRVAIAEYLRRESRKK